MRRASAARSIPYTARVRLGLFGCGSWGRNLLRETLRLDATVFVVDPSPEARAFAERSGANRVFATGADLPGVDGIIVATPASTHFGVISSVLDRGVPVFTEKPFTLDLGEAERLVETAGERIFELHVWRHHPAVVALRDLHRGGTLGPVRWLRTVRTNWTSPRTDCDPVWTLLPHDLSIALELMGEIPDVAFARAELAGGRPCGLMTELRGAYSFIAEVSTRYADKRREIRVHGDEAVAELSRDGNEILIHSGDAGSAEPATRRIVLSSETALERQMRAVMAYFRGGPAPSSSSADALLIARRMHDVRRMAGI